MKNYAAALIAPFLFSACAWHNVGNLTIASTHNVEKDRSQYELLARDIEVRVKAKNNALQVAMDRAVASRPGGEYMMNVMVYMKESNTKKVKITGDVYGTPRPEGTAPAAETKLATDLKVGDRVAARLPGSMVTGTVIGLETDKALIEYEHSSARGTEKKLKAVAFDRITKLQ